MLVMTCGLWVMIMMWKTRLTSFFADADAGVVNMLVLMLMLLSAMILISHDATDIKLMLMKMMDKEGWNHLDHLVMAPGHQKLCVRVHGGHLARTFFEILSLLIGNICI